MNSFIGVVRWSCSGLCGSLDGEAVKNILKINKIDRGLCWVGDSGRALNSHGTWIRWHFEGTGNK